MQKVIVCAIVLCGCGGPPAPAAQPESKTSPPVASSAASSEAPVPSETEAMPQTPADAQSIASIRPLLLACYDKQLHDDPSRQGLVTFVLTVDKTGAVVDANAASKTFGPNDLGCFLSVCRKIPFPPRAASENVTFTVRFARPPNEK
ncbi:MAG: hypothetical protein ACXVEF_33900 [Polyangiales bacterium]